MTTPTQPEKANYDDKTPSGIVGHETWWPAQPPVAPPQHTEHWRFIPETDHKRAEVTTDDARIVAEIFGDGREQRADRGRLIASAPQLASDLAASRASEAQLLAACKELIATVPFIADYRDSDTPHGRALAAIAQAEGRAE